MACNSLDWFLNGFVTRCSVAHSRQNRQKKKSWLLPKWHIMKVSTDASALSGLYPSLPLAFGRSSISCQPRLLSWGSCILLAAVGCRRSVSVLLEEPPSIFPADRGSMEGSVPVLGVFRLQLGCGHRLACCTLGAVKLKWLCLAPTLGSVVQMIPVGKVALGSSSRS